LFNLIVSQRVKTQNWNQFIPGDVMQLNGSHSCFQSEKDDTQLIERLKTFDIHPTGALAGQGELQSHDECKQLETAVFDAWQAWVQGLSRQGLKQERRALRLVPPEFNWQWHNSRLQLTFFLPSGCFATAVLRELAVVEDSSERIIQADRESV
jgi:tRNA pseudouridine13 synthase